MMNLLVKPASGQCNLRCPYCFYCAETAIRQTESFGMMSYETMRKMIEYAFKVESDHLVIAFQGGEPTLRGLQFFKDLVDTVKELAPPNIKINYALQTNGTLLNDKWCEFFRENNFLIGLSLDGTRRYQDMFRIDSKGDGSFEKVFSSVELLSRHKVEFNILTVVTRQVAENVHKIYPFFVKKGLKYHQYIPCLDPFGEDEKYPWSLDEKVFGQFLCDLFDLWYSDLKRGNYISIRYFDNLILMLRGQRPESCGMEGFCTVQNVIEADGSIYPCDFYCLDEYRIGSVFEKPEMVEQKRDEIKFLEDSLVFPEACHKCKFFPICRSGCRRQRDNKGAAPLGDNRFCASYKKFFSYSLTRLEEAARIL